MMMKNVRTMLRVSFKVGSNCPLTDFDIFLFIVTVKNRRNKIQTMKKPEKNIGPVRAVPDADNHKIDDNSEDQSDFIVISERDT